MHHLDLPIVGSGQGAVVGNRFCQHHSGTGQRGADPGHERRLRNCGDQAHRSGNRDRAAVRSPLYTVACTQLVFASLTVTQYISRRQTSSTKATKPESF